ncbi:S-layer homology domain-containing protein [Cohnella xylanilytica]|uniref:S-layer homology domain-containing protein n=1 Tax=Cohnella xylanilytica TaxID=557555 RepID=A0A841U0L1_9BACL|nr:S-layer homology domain-containing protein [Cohnella xylanilytica]MBB6691464.1 S-layer homology domain-containing protein [Cohnella xylanilytica]
MKEIVVTNIVTDAPSLTLSHSPTGSTRGPVTVTVTATVTGSDSGNSLEKLVWLAGSHAAADFAGGTAGTDILASGKFEVAANGTYTVYALDAVGNEAVKEIVVTNIVTDAPSLTLSHSPTGSTRGPVTVTVTAVVTGADSGNSLEKLVWLSGSHTAADFAGGTVGTDILSSGKFEASANGTYTVYARDAAGNEAVKEIAVTNIATDAPSLTLSHSPTGSTRGPVVVTATATVTGADSGNSLEKLVWLAGSHTAADFAGGTAGTDILASGKFEATANGTYTVYARDAVGNESVKEIAITNIATDAPSLTLSHSPTGSTRGPVVVSVTATVTGADSGNSLEKLVWLAGSHTAADFAGGTAGTDILASGKFEATANGTYTVYARDAAGNEAVKEIAVTNIATDAPSLTLSHSPTGSTRGPVTVTVTATVTGADSGNSLEKLVWLAGSHTAADFAGGTAGTDILASGKFEATANGTYTVYARDAVGNESVKEIAITNIATDAPSLTLSHSPTGSTRGPVIVTATATVTGPDSGNSLEKLAWLAGSHTAADFAGGTAGTDITASAKFEAAKNGTYTVYARDAVGNESVKEIAITNIRVSSPSAPVSEPAPSFTIALGPDGGVLLRIAPSMIEKETRKDGTVLEKVALKEEAMNQVLELLKTAAKTVVTVEINDSEDSVSVRFPASSLSEAAAGYPEAVFVTKLNGSSYHLRTKALPLDDLAREMGVELKDLNVVVEMAKVAGEAAEPLKQAAGLQGAKLIGHAIDFQVTASAGDRTTELRSVDGSYSVRSIVLSGDSTSSLLTAVWFDPEARRFQFVPGTIAARSDGKREMTIRVPHNSIYAVVEPGARTFADLNGHWAAGAVERLASRLIVTGVSEDRFAPNDGITRAEFTALLVRSLGLATGEAATGSRFADVGVRDWYAQAVEAAVKAGLVQGVEADRFAPNERITREQMAVMIGQALRLSGATVPAADESRTLADFADAGSISAWARSSVAESVAAGIMNGYPDRTAAPKDFATRAQAVMMLQGFMRYAGLID